MPKVTFHLLNSADENLRYRLACELACKAWNSHFRVHIHTASPKITDIIDDMLWEFPIDQFVPHTVSNNPPELALITLGQLDSVSTEDIRLINTTSGTHELAHRFDSVDELVLSHELDRARSQFRNYRSLSCELFHERVDEHHSNLRRDHYQ